PTFSTRKPLSDRNDPAFFATVFSPSAADHAVDAVVLGDPYADIDKFYPGDSWDAGSLRGSFHQLQKLKEQYPHLKTLISVGGWTWSGRFSDVALADVSRKRFAASCVRFMKTYGFDGIDVDWEYPGGGGLPSNVSRPEDKQNFTLLLEELRRQLDTQGGSDSRSYYLSIAAPAGPAIYAKLELAKIAATLDWINIMTYDFNGGWSASTNFNSPLFASTSEPLTDGTKGMNTHAAVTAYRAAGMEARKINIGAAFYGRGWKGVPGANHGLYQSFTGLPKGTWEDGSFDYKDLKVNYIPKYTRYWHSEARVPWLYSAQEGIMISYDDPESMREKAKYVAEQDLGGVMFWELSGDDTESSLLGALYSTLRE
ncbi:MAG: glycoside hydrolase family 18 protein, partial [Deltaproteobacteria bacterium]|nr:glycoside hydrolase family 18 protein [Deltaproteobacteria bacterium]